MEASGVPAAAGHSASRLLCPCLHPCRRSQARLEGDLPWAGILAICASGESDFLLGPESSTPIGTATEAAVVPSSRLPPQRATHNWSKRKPLSCHRGRSSRSTGPVPDSSWGPCRLLPGVVLLGLPKRSVCEACFPPAPPVKALSGVPSREPPLDVLPGVNQSQS